METDQEEAQSTLTNRTDPLAPGRGSSLTSKWQETKNPFNPIRLFQYEKERWRAYSICQEMSSQLVEIP